MATNFTDQEIETSVSRYVQSDLRISRSPLGPTDLHSKFGEVLSLISATLIFDPNAIFYLIYLSSNRLNTIVQETLTYLDDLIQAINEMGKKTQDVTRTTLLGDAAAALLTVDQILTNQNALSNQAYSRYQTSISKFVDLSLKQNIKEGSDLVRPPQQARKDSITDLQDLSAAYTNILVDSAQLQLMLDEFLRLNLPILAIQDSVRRVRADLQGLQASFEAIGKTRDQRIALCRDAYLTITSGKAVLDNYTTITDPSEARLTSSSSISGQAAVPLGSLGKLLPATVLGTKSAPWPMVTGVSDQLQIAEDGNILTVYTLNAPPQPSVQCYVPEPYAITVGVNDTLEIDSLVSLITLTAGGSRTAANIVLDINTWAAIHAPGVYSASVLSDGGSNYVKITKTQAGIQKITLTALVSPVVTKAAYGTLGFYEGQSDSNTGISGVEVVDSINGLGKVTAALSRTFFEQGVTGIVVNPTTIDLPLNALGSLSHTDDQIIIRSGANAGYHRIVSVVRTTHDRVMVSTDTPFSSIVGLWSWQVYQEKLQLSSKATGLTSKLVVGSGTANTAIGLSAGTATGTTTGFRATKNGAVVDFTQSDVVAKDIAYVKVGLVEAVHTVLELSDSGKQLELDPALSVDAAVASFRIVSSAAVAYQAFALAMKAWDANRAASEFSKDLLELQRVMNPLIANTNPSHAQINDALVHAGYLQTLLLGLSSALVAFVVSPVGRMDASLKMLQERGMDRAYDLLMKGQVANFFGMDKDDAASSAFMLKSMRLVAQKDLPTSKLEDDVDDTSLRLSTTETDANLDYSDQDKDENLRILGETPDFDNPDDQTSTQRWRY